MKTVFICLSVVLFGTYPFVAHSQQGPKFFHYEEIAGQQKTLRKGALEYVVLSGNNTPEGDQRIIDTLKMLQGKNLPAGAPALWRRYRGVIKNMQIIGANWDTLPNELSEFDHLYELTFIRCPNVNLQGINDQIKHRRDVNKKDPLYLKFKTDIVSLTFSNTDFAAPDSCHLDVALLEELRELRFIGITHFSRHCENLLTEVNHAYPSLGWLTIEGCQLDDLQSLLPLQGFKKLKSVSLARNYLTEMPAVPKSLQALDLSYNFLHAFPSKTEHNSPEALRFIYLECNLFDYFNLYKVLSDTIFKGMEVFSYDPCNFDQPEDLQRISNALDKRKVAIYMPFVARYQNDFIPAPPDCQRCQPHRDAFIARLLDDVMFVDSSGNSNHIAFEPGNNRMYLRSQNSGLQSVGSRIFMYKQLKECRRYPDAESDLAHPWDWTLSFSVEDAESTRAELKTLVIKIKGKNGVLEWETVEQR